MAPRVQAFVALLATTALLSALAPAFIAAGSEARAPPTAFGRFAAAQRVVPPQVKASQPFVGAAGIAAFMAVGAALARQALTVRRLRLAGKEIPRNKELAYALMCAVFGIGKTTAFKICVDCGIDPHKTVSTLSEDEELRLAEELGKYTLENPLRRMYKANCTTLLEIKHRRGIRMSKGLPVRWQRSKTNNRNARKLNPFRV
eukprot:gb/GFBE01068854.1/.p1 GENE.gb/GFBE01068854.1/~~gb/GFBE01068854.1/.p1  ORF type:complete len:202 (+),score=47.30 gb/GFBE01068854.1/:1-606(+)